MRVSRRGHHWSASPVLRIAISTVGKGFSLHGRAEGNKATSISGPRALLWVTSPDARHKDNRASFTGFQAQAFLALHSTVWFPGAHEGLMVTILWSLKFLGNQLWPSPFTTREGFVKATMADAVLSRKGHYVTGWQCSNPIKHRQSSYQFISAGSTSPRVAAEQRLLTGLLV